MGRFLESWAAVAVLTLGVTVGAQAQDISINPEGPADAFKVPSYSPYAGRAFPTKLLWGDTHLHTNLSLDARAAGVILGPDDAYRFARGEEVTTTNGIRIKLGQPLDWLVVTDHSDAMGAMNEIVAGNPSLLTDPKVRDWHKKIVKGGKSALEAAFDVVTTFSQGKTPKILLTKAFGTNIWHKYLAAAEANNDPGRFSAIIGYEWTSTTGGNNLHRNVIYRDGVNSARHGCAGWSLTTSYSLSTWKVARSSWPG